MTKQPVCAVIVTFHPSADTLNSVLAILPQVQGLVIIDNGSYSDELNKLRDAKRALGFELIENGENCGIAAALNQGVQWAMDQKYRWVILFDQDSRVTEAFIDQMFSTWNSYSQRLRLASIHPRYVEADSGLESKFPRAKDGGLVKSLTSGALMPTWIFEEIGLFASEYFIDGVDTEYCFRIRAAGYLIAESKSAVLLHSIGTPKKVSFMGFSFRPSYHNAVRRYYMSRNRIALYRSYYRALPRFVLREVYEGFRETVKCFLAEPDRLLKFRNFLLGTWDGLTGKMGRQEKAERR